jgi:hypothetical protein
METWRGFLVLETFRLGIICVAGDLESLSGSRDFETQIVISNFIVMTLYKY